MTDEDWIRNEWIEERLHNHRSSLEDSPPLHLYDWLQVVNPELFKQWQAVFDIESEIK